MTNEIYKPPESDLVKDRDEIERVNKPVVLWLVQIVTWIFLLSHLSAFGRFSKPFITPTMMLGIGFISISVVGFSIFILTSISGKHPKVVKRIFLYFGWIFIVILLMGIFRHYGAYSPSIKLEPNQVLGGAIAELQRVIVPLILMVWLKLSDKTASYIEQENRPPKLT